ncbi:CPBP family intramembrane metalloprotease [Candidatus Heimdallarchaeota archaeon]|nr:MAG: CPBP family intramembrane metalloprotease [Candidatus Heimdallarchaeota archaeon]
MQKKRLILDSLFILLSISLFTVIRVILERNFPTNEVNQGTILPGYSIAYSVFLYFGIIIVYLIYGWALRRWFIKKELSENDNSLKHVYLIFLSFFLIITLNFIIVYFTSKEIGTFYSQLTSALFEILQLSAIGTTFGVLFYPQIEDQLGLLIFKQTLQADEKKLGLGSFQKQVRYYSKKYWKILMVILGFVIMFSNLLLVIVYPSIPATSEAGLAFFYPNFDYTYNPETELRQNFFDYSIIPSSVIINWKLAQSIMSLIVFIFIVLIIYLPSRNKKSEHDDRSQTLESSVEPQTQEEIAFQILTTTENTIEQSSESQKASGSKKFIRNFFSRAFNKDFVGVIGLLCLNFAISLLILFIIQNMGLLDLSQLQTTDIYDGLYIDLSQLFWAGFGEEITFRWMIFGLPLFLIYGLIYIVIRLNRTLRKTIDHPSKNTIFSRYFDKIEKTNPLFYLIGGWKRLDFIGIIFLIFSSFAFGYVHYANGWGAWKILQAGVAGAIFGYAYVKYGLHASILLHSVNNFVVGFVVTPNYGLIVTGEFLFLILTFLGAFFVFYVCMVVLSKFFKGMNILFGRYNKELS